MHQAQRGTLRESSSAAHLAPWSRYRLHHLKSSSYVMLCIPTKTKRDNTQIIWHKIITWNHFMSWLVSEGNENARQMSLFFAKQDNPRKRVNLKTPIPTWYCAQKEFLYHFFITDELAKVTITLVHHSSGGFQGNVVWAMKKCTLLHDNTYMYDVYTLDN